MKNLILFVFLLFCVPTFIQEDVPENSKEFPEWIPFEAYLDNREGCVYTNIKTNMA